ncbi:hypothetical protein J4526_09250 [Desulfurococcaceae archaeon MEX13E-LK6-19]|nr:hypothetical protein J4526_09250 [Desulfurococcaceae archaeon MEX13E-LK6-19]
MPVYIVVSGNKFIGMYDNFNDALKKLVEVGGGMILRGEKIIDLLPEEASELASFILEKTEPVEAPTSRKPRLVVVLDQMFKGYFAPILSRQFPDIDIYEIVGKGLTEPVKIGNVVKHPAQDDFDVINLLEELSSKKHKVIFFTGDKKLATQASLIKDIKVVYAPPSEFTGKEALAKYMINEVNEALKK